VRSNKRFWSLPATLIIVFLAVVGYLWFNQPRIPSLPDPPLKVLAAKQGIELGNFAILTRINEKPYQYILTSQFDFALADNTPNWYFTDGGLRPSAKTFNFKQMDEVMAFAQKHQMPVQAHHFVWGEEKWLPDWLKNGQYTPAQLLDIIHQHIATVGTRYKGKVREWTVVNEAFTRQQHISGLHDWWADHIGDPTAPGGYIDQSFIWARQADPNAKLLLNDFANEHPGTVADNMYEYIKAAKARGVPIDGVGLQMHIDGTMPASKDDVIKTMQRFASLGVGVYVTEFDVDMSKVPGDALTKDQQEGDIYYDFMRACIESQVCHSFAILGITDKETWYKYLASAPDARPLPFDNRYQPKPAYYSMRAALEQK